MPSATPTPLTTEPCADCPFRVRAIIELARAHGLTEAAERVRHEPVEGKTATPAPASHA